MGRNPPREREAVGQNEWPAVGDPYYVPRLFDTRRPANFKHHALYGSRPEWDLRYVAWLYGEMIRN